MARLDNRDRRETEVHLVQPANLEDPDPRDHQDPEDPAANLEKEELPDNQDEMELQVRIIKVKDKETCLRNYSTSILFMYFEVHLIFTL